MNNDQPNIDQFFKESFDDLEINPPVELKAKVMASVGVSTAAAATTAAAAATGASTVATSTIGGLATVKSLLIGGSIVFGGATAYLISSEMSSDHTNDATHIEHQEERPENETKKEIIRLDTVILGQGDDSVFTDKTEEEEIKSGEKIPVEKQINNISKPTSKLKETKKEIKKIKRQVKEEIKTDNAAIKSSSQDPVNHQVSAKKVISPELKTQPEQIEPAKNEPTAAPKSQGGFFDKYKHSLKDSTNKLFE